MTLFMSGLEYAVGQEMRRWPGHTCRQFQEQIRLSRSNPFGWMSRMEACRTSSAVGSLGVTKLQSTANRESFDFNGA